MNKKTGKNSLQFIQYLIYYDLSQEQIDILEGCLPENTMLHDATLCATDIIAIPALGVVINPTAMPTRDLEMILDYYKEVGWNLSELVVFTKKIAVPMTAKIIYLDDGDFNARKVQTLLSQANARKKRNAGYHARIALCLLVLKTIRNRPGISTKSIADECDVSEKSILRFIETLRVSGEWIDYDHQSRGWKLHPAMSSFFA